MNLKSTITTVFFLFAGLCAFCQQEYKVMVDPASSLNIHGKTNINKFICAQRPIMSKDTITLEMRQNGNEWVMSDAVMRVPVIEFDCGISKMTEDFCEMLDAENHPYLQLILHSVERAETGQQYIADLTIVLAGEESRYHIPVQVHQNEYGLIGSGMTQVRFQDFNMEPPVKFMGMVKVNEMLDISFNFIIRQLL